VDRNQIDELDSPTKSIGTRRHHHHGGIKSGKSTIASLLAMHLHWEFEDGDWPGSKVRRLGINLRIGPELVGPPILISETQ
jgi:hypothetical protein